MLVSCVENYILGSVNHLIPPVHLHNIVSNSLGMIEGGFFVAFNLSQRRGTYLRESVASAFIRCNVKSFQSRYSRPS